MNVFGDYSKFYDLLYVNKPYQQESIFVDTLIKQYGTQSETKTLLELGCGTGRHAYYLAEQGYEVHGVDQSSFMLEMAGNFFASAPENLRKSVFFEQADIRQLSLKKQFDVAISLFHVMSYQITNLDLASTFQSVKNHVKPGGLFIFDCWYGPAVLTQRPEVRFKQFENEALLVERVASPILYENDNTIEVNYHLFVKEKQSETYQKINETHRMRYLFYPEISSLCQKFNMTLVHGCEWLTNKTLSQHTWGGCFVVKL